LGVPHFALKDVVIEGYTIPKGATVMASLYHSMRDPSVFKNPEIFDPARFIDAGNNFFIMVSPFRFDF
jgi:cytochrome P450